MEQNTLYTAIGRLDRETNGCGRSCPVIRLGGQTYCAGWGAIHGGYAGNGRLDRPKLANF